MCGMEYGMEQNMFTILPRRTTFALQKMRNTTHPLPPFFVVIVVSFLITSLSYFLVFFFFFLIYFTFYSSPTQLRKQRLLEYFLG